MLVVFDGVGGVDGVLFILCKVTKGKYHCNRNNLMSHLSAF